MNRSNIYITGIGCTKAPGVPHISMSFKDLLVEATYQAINDANINPQEIDGASFSYAGEGEIGHGGITPTLVDCLGLSPLRGYVNIANCASAHIAFMQGCEMIESGRYKHVLVAGFDKLTDVLPFENYMLLSTDSMFDYNLGFSHIDAFLLQQEYIRKYKIPPQKIKAALLKFGKLMREYGSKNEVATFYKKTVPTLDKLKMLPFCGNAMQAGEGASAIILSSKDENNSYPSIQVVGRSFENTAHYIPLRYEKKLYHKSVSESFGMFNGISLQTVSNKAFQEAKVGPKDLNILELYDQGLNSFISLEAIGICPKGSAINYILNNGGAINSDLPINTDGGNIARGHAAGGASLYQLIEIVKQLQNRSTGFQIPKRNYGMSTVIGGAYATTAAVILKRMGD